MYHDLKRDTSICTMSCDTLAALNNYERAVRDNAVLVDAGLISYEEAKSAIYNS